MSASVASSEPSSVGMPVSTWSLAGDSLNSNSFHRHRSRNDATMAAATTSLYPTGFAVAAAAAMPSYHDDTVKECPLCGNLHETFAKTANKIDNNNNRNYKTTGLEEDGYGVLFDTAVTSTPTSHRSDFELASMLQTAAISHRRNNNNKITGEAAAAAAMGACGVCVAAIADAAREDPHPHPPFAAFSTSFSTLESFHDEPSFAAAALSPTATLSMDDFENDLYFQRHPAKTAHNSHQYEEPLEGESVTTTTVVYIGEYNHLGQRHASHGELIWDNGDRYVGSFVCGKRTGTGTMFHRDGSTYTGDWLNNLMHGKGQRNFASGDVYVGKYQYGKRCGGPNCKLKFVNGDLYVGSWESNYFHGFGRYFFADGTALAGTFEHGQKQGKFKRQKPSGYLDILRYENDRVVGQGVRWNETRTKTWLLRVVVDKNHRRVLSHDTSRSRSAEHRVRTRDRRRRSTSPSLASGTNTSDLGRQRSFASLLSVEPLVERQAMPVAKKAGRIPVAQAVSIGYDCELGDSIRDTNPAFWSVGDFGRANPSDGHRLHDSSSNFV